MCQPRKDYIVWFQNNFIGVRAEGRFVTVLFHLDLEPAPNTRPCPYSYSASRRSVGRRGRGGAALGRRSTRRLAPLALYTTRLLRRASLRNKMGVRY